MTELKLFFLVTGFGTLIFLSLPIFICPLGWAKKWGWPVEKETNLTLYFGRSLGGIAVSLSLACIVGALTDGITPLFTMLAVMILASATLVHLYGALKRIQPISETVEIFIYGAWTLWALRLYLLS